MESLSQKTFREQLIDIASYIDPNEKIIAIEPQTILIPEKLMDVHEALAYVCKVSKVEDIGMTGPPLASIALGENMKVKALRRYEAVFGRDSLYMADHVLHLYPQLARVTLLYLASMQGLKFDTYREEEPGRIPHEVRDDDDERGQELTKERKWLWPFYGSIDSTLLFIRLIYRYVHETKEGMAFLDERYIGRDGKERTIRDAIKMGVEWIQYRRTKNKEKNKEGFIESYAAFPESMIMQSLQDSAHTDTLFDRNGRYAKPKQGVIPIEVQGQAYDALLYASELLNDNSLFSEAENLKTHIFDLWVEDERGGFFAAGADRDDDGNLRVMDIRKSIAGFLLNTELFKETSEETQTKLQKWVKTLMSSTMLAPGGLRSLAADEAHYTPVAYHNGSVWAVLTYEVAIGLRKQGFIREADDLENRILKSIEAIKAYPEYVRGDPTEPIHINTRIIVSEIEHMGRHKLEHPPQLYQGWTISAVASILSRRNNSRHRSS